MDFARYRSLDATAMAELVAGGEVKPAELLAAARDRAAAVNPRLNAIIRPMDDLADARLDEELSGPFAGVPFLLKDLGQDYAGVPTSAGCRALKNYIPTEHATVVQRWLDAGLVIFGKTNTPEFGSKGITEPALWGPTRNPWNLAHTPGGSSGGSAAAVAAGIVPVAGANDGGGSIRIPAACCGLFGLKAGRGVVPHGPAEGDGNAMSAQGVVSRSVRDTAAMLDVLAGADPYAPSLPATLPPGSYLAEVGREPGRLRIGVRTTSALNPTPSPEAVAALDDATALLRELGHDVEAVEQVVDEKALATDFLTAWYVKTAHLVAQARAAGGDGFETDTLIIAELGRTTDALSLELARSRWHGYTRALVDFHRRYDLLLTPTLAREPLKVAEVTTSALETAAGMALVRLRAGTLLRRLGVIEKAVLANLSWVPFTQLANLTGRPAMSVPLYWTAGGLPLGVQFVAPLGGEGTLLRVAAQLEAARPWFDRVPDLA
ncbi:amidase [Pseudofrankia inefficax]|uniref:Amidase n=1 Tax=Pseudofrankia inefficax (strain DSM 45817 / CECT 9037 / DDB 130130 / EuI1c) TaxID=298654 RepID=E3J2Y0_PSEI1|nr:amidase [Pseudofrankia inefficax]ADP81791.1 Amidase [Pseudofrankia inefficax]